MSEVLINAKALLAEYLEDLAELEESIDDLKEFITNEEARLIAEENDLWTAPDEFGGMQLKPMMAIYEKFQNGTRAERLWAKTYSGFHNKLLATIGETTSPRNLTYYSRAQTKYFAFAMIGGGPVLAEVIEKDEDGNITEYKEGYLIPWYGNYGPRGATKWFEEEWSRPDKEEACRNRAERRLKSLDRRYDLARRTGTINGFMQKYPFYEAE